MSGTASKTTIQSIARLLLTALFLVPCPSFASSPEIGGIEYEIASGDALARDGFSRPLGTFSSGPSEAFDGKRVTTQVVFSGCNLADPNNAIFFGSLPLKDVTGNYKVVRELSGHSVAQEAFRCEEYKDKK